MQGPGLSRIVRNAGRRRSTEQRQASAAQPTSSARGGRRPRPQGRAVRLHHQLRAASGATITEDGALQALQNLAHRRRELTARRRMGARSGAPRRFHRRLPHARPRTATASACELGTAGATTCSVEEYPLAERDLAPDWARSHWLLDTEVAGFAGVARFVVGTARRRAASSTRPSLPPISAIISERIFPEPRFFADICSCTKYENTNTYENRQYIDGSIVHGTCRRLLLPADAVCCKRRGSS